MKKLFIILVLSIALFSCDDEKDDKNTDNSIAGEYSFKEIVELEKSVYVEGGRKLNANEIPESINELIDENFYQDGVVDSNLVLVLTDSLIYEKGNELSKIPYIRTGNKIKVNLDDFIIEYTINGNNLEQEYSLYSYITTDLRSTSVGEIGINGSFDAFLAENEVILSELGEADTIVHFRAKSVLLKLQLQ